MVTQTQAQADAIKALSTGGSLSTQLFAGKNPSVIASSSAVPSFMAPKPITPSPQAMATIAPPSPFATSNVQTSTPAVIPQTPQIQKPTIPDPSTAVKSIVQASDGSHTTTFHAPETDTAPTSTPAPTPSIFQTPSGAQVDTQGNTVKDAPGQGTFSGILSGLISASNSNKATAEKANKIASKYATEIDKTNKAGTGQEIGQRTTGTQSVGEGNALNTANATSERIAGLANAEDAELKGTGQELTANAQTQSGFNQAGGLAQPSGSFPFVFDPTTGSFKTPGGGTGSGSGSTFTPTFNPATDAQNYADAVINHQISYDDAVKALGYAGPTAESFLTSAITGKGGNVTQLKAQTDIQGTQEAQVQGYKSALQQGQNLQAQLKDLITTFGLNPNDVNVANQGIQKIAKNTSDPHYQALQNYVNDVANTYAQILTPPGGSATDTTRSIASSMLDATASGESILSVMQSLDNASQAKIAGVQTIKPGASSGSGSGGSSLYDF